MLCYILMVLSCDNEPVKDVRSNSQLIIIYNDSIVSDSAITTLPKATSGTAEEYIITFAEWQDKSTNVTCIVIRQDSVFTIINDGSLTGKKNEVIESGILRIHKKTGKTILTNELEDIHAPEIGGCSDGPIVVDLKNKIIELC